MSTAQATSQKTFSDYVMTHCTTCPAGWVRKNDRGEYVIFCLLDREAVWPEMTDCNKYELQKP